MGVIKDINDKIAPRAQELTEKQGLSIKQALVKSFEECGYFEVKKEGDNNG